MINRNKSLNILTFREHSMKNRVANKKAKLNNFNTTSTTIIKKEFKENQIKDNIATTNNVIKNNENVDNNIFDFAFLKKECIKICKDKSKDDLINLINTANNLEELLYFFINYILPIL